MGHGYRAVGWNRQKRLYDAVLAGGILLYLATFLGVSAAARPNATIETLLIRALGTCAFLLLHVILSIGPLARLDRRFLPWLYNRRHLGVAAFALALAHGGLSLFQFHALGDVHPLVSLLTSNGDYGSWGRFPFQVLGAGALAILALMAATSHDFWLARLTAPAWKRLHMLVYLAYFVLVLHVALGALQSERSPLLAAVLMAGVAWLVALHLLAALREARRDREAAGRSDAAGYRRVCAVDEIPEGRAAIRTLGGERVAIFRWQGKVAAVSNVCQHQNGPLGEGRVLDGCIVCPWHGYEYDPETGASPPPFEEKVPTFRVRVERGEVWVHPRPLPAGTGAGSAAVGADDG